MRDTLGISDANYQEVFRTNGVISIGLAVSFIADEMPELDEVMIKRNPQLVRDVHLKLKAEKNLSLTELVGMINEEQITELIDTGNTIIATAEDETTFEVAKEEGVSALETLQNAGADPERLSTVSFSIKEDGVVDGKRIYHPTDTTVGNGEQVITFLPWVDQEKAVNRQLVFRRRNRPTDPYVFCAREGEGKPFPFDRPEDGKFQYVDLDFLHRTMEFRTLFIRLIYSGNRPSEYFRVVASVDERRFPFVRVAAVSCERVPMHLQPRHRQKR